VVSKVDSHFTEIKKKFKFKLKIHKYSILNKNKMSANIFSLKNKMSANSRVDIELLISLNNLQIRVNFGMFIVE